MKNLMCSVVLTVLLSGLAGGSLDAAEKWPGVDEAVVKRIAREQGRAERPPLIPSAEGDLQLFMFLLAGAVGGLLYGGFPGFLRARTGAHEVISTIMLNNIAILFVRWLVTSQDPVVLRDPNSSVPRTRPVASTG